MLNLRGIMRGLVPLAAVALLAGCMNDVTSARPVSLSGAQVAQIKSAATAGFYDPGSAQFRDIQAVDVTLTDGRTERRVCGYVNGKNLYGGYTGFEFFGGVMTGGLFRNSDFPMPCQPG